MRSKTAKVVISVALVAVFAWVGVFLYAMWYAPSENALEAVFSKQNSQTADGKKSTGSDDTSNSDASGDTKTDGNTSGSANTSADSSDSEKNPPEEKPKEYVTKPEAQVTGANITVLGDSVIEMVATKLEETYPGIVVDGAVNRSFHVVDELLDAELAAGTLRHYVVVGVANNAVIPDAKIDGWVSKIGPDRVLCLVTGHGTARTTWIPEANAAIQRAAKRYPQQVVVADWYSVAQAHPEALYRDQTHPNPDGEPVFVAEVTRALTVASKFPMSVEEVK